MGLGIAKTAGVSGRGNAVGYDADGLLVVVAPRRCQQQRHTWMLQLWEEHGVDAVLWMSETWPDKEAALADADNRVVKALDW